MNESRSISPVPNDTLRTAAADEEQVTVHAIARHDSATTVVGSGERTVIVFLRANPNLSDREKNCFRVRGRVRQYCRGQSGNRDYLVFGSDATISEAPDFEFEGSSDAERDESDKAAEGAAVGKTGSSKRPAHPGKRVVKDAHGERVTGRNPLADPERMKDAGLHQGGN